MITTKLIEGGDIFASPCRVLVNPVNCVGVSGKGLAKEFKKRFPLSVKAYEKDIRDASNGRSAMTDLWLGSPTDYNIEEHDKIVMFFATKLHWKDASELEHIDDGLCELVAMVVDTFLETGLHPAYMRPALKRQLEWAEEAVRIVDA